MTTPLPTALERGRIAYEVFCGLTGGLTTPWEHVVPHQRQAWAEAVSAASSAGTSIEADQLAQELAELEASATKPLLADFLNSTAYMNGAT